VQLKVFPIDEIERVLPLIPVIVEILSNLLSPYAKNSKLHLQQQINFYVLKLFS